MTDDTANTADAAIAILAERGIRATWEHPGFILVAIDGAPAHPGLTYGREGDEWYGAHDADTLTGYVEPWTSGVLPASASADEIAAVLQAAHAHVTARRAATAAITEIREGIWCPWSAVLCWPCHAGMPNDPGGAPGAWRDIGPEHEIAVDPATVCRCDGCGRPVSTRPDVAMLSRLRDRLALVNDIPPMSLQQTGGMCASLEGADHSLTVAVFEGGDEAAVVAFDSSDEDCSEPLEGLGGMFDPADIEAGAHLVIGAFAART